MSAASMKRRLVRLAGLNRRALVVVLCLCLLVHQAFRGARGTPAKAIDSAELLHRRNSFTNAVYGFWDDRGFRGVNRAHFARMAPDRRCVDYFGRLTEITDPDAVLFDVEGASSFRLDKKLYKRKKWLRESRVDVMSKLQQKRIKFTEDHLHELEQIYAGKASEVSNHERQIFDVVSHARVYGQCFVENPVPLAQTAGAHCAAYYKKLYPWLTTAYPLFENWAGELAGRNLFPVYNASLAEKIPLLGCFIHDFIARSRGAGIVIPILPVSDKRAQITRLRGLLKVLRALKNDIPIQVVFFEDEFSTQDREKLRHTARRKVNDVPQSYNAHRKKLGLEGPIDPDAEFPKQDIHFVNLSPLLNNQKFPMLIRSKAVRNPTLMIALATVFNSFEKVIVMTSDAVPLDPNFAKRLLERTDFKRHGHIFFKMPARFKAKKKRILPGYDEVNNLVRDYLTPSVSDDEFLGLKRRDTSGIIGRVLNGRVQGILDSSMYVIDKKRTTNAFLMAANLQFHKLLNHRFEVSDNEVSSDYLWMGIELAGTSDKSNFNGHLGAAVGVLTPFENEPHDVVNQAHELCSSSWGQIDSEDDYTIIYVTSHQLENWMEEPSFRVSLEQKYVIQKADASNYALKQDRELYESTVKRNPLYINSALIPPDHRGLGYAFSKAGEREPNAGWIATKDFAPRAKYEYWCGYDVVSGNDANKKGRILDYGETFQARANFLLDIWLM